MAKTIHLTDGVRLLNDGGWHEVRCWKLSTGDLLHYKECRAVGRYGLGRCTRLKFRQSGAIRAMRDISLVEIDGLRCFI